jgi:hypothetical protein
MARLREETGTCTEAYRPPAGDRLRTTHVGRIRLSALEILHAERDGEDAPQGAVAHQENLFSVDGSGKTFDGFETALLGLTLPAIDGVDGVQLITNTYTTSTAGSSTFILETS